MRVTILVVSSGFEATVGVLIPGRSTSPSLLYDVPLGLEIDDIFSSAS